MTEVRRDRQVLWPTLKVTGAAGVGGLLFGTTAGILRSSTPALFATAASLQWALLGGTYWGVRTSILNTRPTEEEITNDTKIYTSMLSGGLSFALVGAVTRGRKNVIPGTIMGTLIGYAGQKGYILLDERNTKALTTPSTVEPFWKRVLSSKYSPMKPLSDEQYAQMLREKLLRVDTDIAVIDDDIERWRKVQAEGKENVGKPDGDAK
ncbi:hypothetical protein EJ08DRAFT_697969 [Tothia fuscella]|uniref:Uncharacterized protein n=1 Tax=Tothia fuscella TaxID=1048955 RepID=A0A9P4TYA8_9PEZI|nr:hypothetical protein EJ08DRAFT_697969 [Tothia fuscella]